MSEVVSQNQMSAMLTPINGTTADATVVLGNDNNIRTKHNAHDSEAGVHFQSSTLALRPAFGSAGRKWFTTDDRKVWYDTGAAWVEVAYAGLAAPSFTGGITVAGGVAVSSGGAAITGNSSVTGTLSASGLLSALAGLSVGTTLVIGGRTYTWPGSETANYYLKTNGSGTLSWGAVSTVSVSGLHKGGSQSIGAGASAFLSFTNDYNTTGTGLTHSTSVNPSYITAVRATVVQVHVDLYIASIAAGKELDIWCDVGGVVFPEGASGATPNRIVTSTGGTSYRTTFIVPMAAAAVLQVNVTNGDASSRTFVSRISVSAVS